MRAQRSGPAARWHYDITAFDDGSTGGWLPGFADFSPETAAVNRVAELRDLPRTVTGSGTRGYYLQGRNTSDDLFMYLKKPVTGLAPGRAYRASFYVEVASDAPTGCVGIGGPPGEAVTLKAGATAREPLALLDDGMVRLNIDKGNQVAIGADGVLLGNIANGIPCQDSTGQYAVLRRSAAMTNTVRTDGTGVLWVWVGTDSGFEGTTGVYYAFIAVLLTLAD
ncbi:MAG: hypothetical protein JNK87_09530 [Bryobacterales bacterium]|nr:hypothetical protein [Bryobacterales bacterium]